MRFILPLKTGKSAGEDAQQHLVLTCRSLKKEVKINTKKASKIAAKSLNQKREKCARLSQKMP